MAENKSGKVTLESSSRCAREAVNLPQQRYLPRPVRLLGLRAGWRGAKRNVKDAWWRSIVRERDDVMGLDTSILMNSKFWEASGHVSNHSYLLVE